MADREYPARDRIGFVSSGDRAKDEAMLDDYIRHEKRMIEGICPNGCAEMIVDNPHERHCPVCGFCGWSNVPWASA